MKVAFASMFALVAGVAGRHLTEKDAVFKLAVDQDVTEDFIVAVVPKQTHKLSRAMNRRELRGTKSSSSGKGKGSSSVDKKPFVIHAEDDDNVFELVEGEVVDFSLANGDDAVALCDDTGCIGQSLSKIAGEVDPDNDECCYITVVLGGQEANFFDIHCPSPLMTIDWMVISCEDFGTTSCEDITVENDGYLDDTTTVIKSFGSKAQVETASSTEGLFYTIDFTCCEN